MIIALQTLIFFRESLLTVFDRVIRPYYKRISIPFISNAENAEEDEPDEQVFSEFDDEKGVVFFPPMYSQRYAAVSDCLMDERWRGKLEKVVDFGYHDMSFIKYLREVPGIQRILGVDIESMPLRCSSDLFAVDEYSPRRESPLQVTLFQGNAADPDYRLIGCDAVIAIEMIEHMLPHDLDRLVHNVFGFIKPWIAVFTTPNGDFNVLFKSLEKNGYRRWDHFFEWSREQFNEWCSNIILRYPNYSVTCQGVGPGPPGTLHYGCCSQLALFVNKQYHKQQDLNINSLALVPMPPTPAQTTDLSEGWDTPALENGLQTDIDNYGAPYGIESLTEFICNEKQSNLAFVYSPDLTNSMPLIPVLTESEQSISSFDKVSQCDLDYEYGKNFLMFDDEYDCMDVRVPTRSEPNKVYNIEDVTCRLNCSTLQVKKFSKTTQNLMAKNKIDSVHTREVVDEIRQLTKTLKFNKCIMDEPENGSTWCNINWGDDAPYWNQYYKVVKEYNYPFETKSEECRILDLISEEINQLIDSQCDEATTCVQNRLEIPLTDLMGVVEHITDDINMVRDILVWNGYEIVDDVVIHSRLAVDIVSVGTHEEDWQDNVSNFSDWDNDTEVQSTTASEGSTIVPDSQDRCLRRALDHKLRNLRTMLSGDEDITTELDKVVCKLMKLALRTSMRRTTPPPAKWMQCKLLDLLTLTEKAIQRRKQQVIEDSMKAIKFDFIQDDSKQKIANNAESQDDSVLKDINDNNYKDTTEQPGVDNSGILTTPFPDFDPQDNSFNSVHNKFKDLVREHNGNLIPNSTLPLTLLSAEAFQLKPEINSMERTKAWLDEDIDEVPYPNEENMNFDNISSVDSDSITNKQNKVTNGCTAKEDEPNACLTSSSKTSSSKFKLKREEKKRKTSSTRITKKMSRRISPNYNIVKNPDIKNPGSYDNYILRAKRKSKENQCLTMRASKPIPESLIDLCNPELKGARCVKEFLNEVDTTNNIVVLNQPSPIAVVEESLLVDIIMDDNTQGVIPLCNSTDNSTEEPADICNKNRSDIKTDDIDINLCTRHEVSTENIYAQTIFLNDINEPSTSKGIRHNVSMDVQCGPDSLPTYPVLSTSTSLVRLPQGFSAGIKIQDGAPDIIPATDFGTSTQENHFGKTITPRSRSIGIKIKDSDVNIFPASFSTIAQRAMEVRNRYSGPRSWSPESNMMTSDKQVSFVTTADISFNKTDLLNPIPSTSNAECSSCEICPSDGSILKSCSQLDNSTKTDRESLILNPLGCTDSNIIGNFENTANKKPKLSCGGVHVHSYRDKQESEDIVYQGKWQRCRPKSGKKKTQNTILAKKFYDSGTKRQKETVKDKNINNKDKMLTQKYEKNDSKQEYKKTLQRNVSMLQKQKREVVTEAKKNNLNKQLGKTAKDISSSVRTNRQNINVTKVASKIAMSSVPSKNIKSAFTAKKPQLTTGAAGKKETNSQKLKKNYIPFYMRKRNSEALEKNRFNESISPVNFDLDSHKESSKKGALPIISIKNEDLRKDLLNFQGNITENTYLVFRNENQENCNPSNEQHIVNTTNNEDNIIPNGTFIKRTRSHQSLNSSTCSSPNSIVTVRAVNTKSKQLSFRRHSASSHRSSLNTSESDNPTPTKAKKSLKRCKTAKRTDNNKENNNKENIPMTTENFSNKDSEKFVKSPFAGQHTNICITQMKPDRPSMHIMTSKHKTPRLNKSNIKIPTPQDTIDKKRSLSASVSRKRSRTSSSNSVINNKDVPKRCSESANMVYVLNAQEPKNIIRVDDVASSVVNSVCAEPKVSSRVVTESSNAARDMEQLIGELLSSIDFPTVINSRSRVLHTDDAKNHSLELNDSFNSFVTVTANYLNSTAVDSDKENVLNSTLDTMLGNESIVSIANTRLTVTDFDLLSFKSITSVSKDSEYFIPDSELSEAIGKVEFSQESNPIVLPISVTDIFERKEHLLQNPPGPLANIAFSGFSLDAESVTSKPPDPIALVDSETGSLATGQPRTRQATSEELFISGRSSESYQSCLIDEDAVVPNWLFQIISQQQSQVVDQQPMIGPQPAPVGQESIYDINGNAVEPGVIDAVAGAGDGRGIHSDQSQDSSGRGTSLSSSDTSSSPQSDTIIMNPSTFTGQMELLRDPVTSSALTSSNVNEDHSRDEFSRNMEGADRIALAANSRRRQRTFSNEASDISADISSIDTDVPDSDE